MMFNNYFFTIPAILLFLSGAAVIFRNWRNGVILIFFWLLAEDLIRRLIPVQLPQILLVKDVLIFLSYCSFFAAMAVKKEKVWRPPFIVPFLFFAALVFIGIFNPQAPNLFFGLIGLKSYLWYALLMFLGYHMFRSGEEMLKFCRILVYTAMPLFIFIVFQYLFYDYNFPLLRSLETSHQFHNFTLVENKIIPLLPSVFGSAHRFARFSMLLFFLALSLLFVKKSKILAVSAASAFLGIILSGSRSAFVLTIIGIVLFMAFGVYFKHNKMFYLWQSSRIRLFLVLLALALAIIMIFIVSDLGIFHITAFYYAFEERIPWAFAEFARAFSEAKFFGNGTGTMSQGLGYIPGGPEWVQYQSQELRNNFWFETGISKILFELGFVGLFIFYWFWTHFFSQAKKEIKKIQNSLKNMAISISIFAFLMLIWFSFLHHQTLGDATTLTILWFFIGVLFNLKNLDLETDYMVK